MVVTQLHQQQQVYSHNFNQLHHFDTHFDHTFCIIVSAEKLSFEILAFSFQKFNVRWVHFKENVDIILKLKFLRHILLLEVVKLSIPGQHEEVDRLLLGAPWPFSVTTSTSVAWPAHRLPSSWLPEMTGPSSTTEKGARQGKQSHVSR